MHILYMVPNHNMSNSNCGVTKKINSQKKAFHQLGFNGNLIYFLENELYLEKIDNETAQLIKSNADTQEDMYDYIIKKYNLSEVKCIYIRYPRCSNRLIKFLRKIKQKNIPVYLEIVTYPYDKEDWFYIRKYKVDLKTKISYTLKVLEDKITRNKLKKYVDKIVTFSEDQEIFGIKTISTSNGIDSDSILHSPIEKDDKVLSLIGVGGIAKHHGYDRVILGIKEYIEKDTNIIFNIVGDGEENENLKKIVEDHSLENYVKFHGFKGGNELNNLYRQSHIAIGSIGRHRNNIYQLSDLKSREYCAQAIPFIKTVKDLDFEGFPFCYNIEPNDSPVNIEEILQFYNKVKSIEDYQQKMINYANECLTWKSKLQCILEDLEL